MIIDAHTHITKLSNSRFAESYEKNLKFLLSEAHKNKVEHLLIIAGFENRDSFNAALSTKKLIKLVGNKSNISLVGSVDIVRYGKNDLLDLEAWLKKKIIVGIKFNLGYQHIYPADKRCGPIYKLCLKYKVPAIFHTGDTLTGVVKNPKVKYAHPIHIDDVATDFPDLKIVIAHMGNPWLTDCAEVLYKNRNVYADISGIFVGDELNTPYGALTRQKIKELVAYVGSNKLLYGTDWPLCPMSPYIKFAKSLFSTKEDRDKLFYKNTAEVFNLKI